MQCATSKEALFRCTMVKVFHGCATSKKALFRCTMVKSFHGCAATHTAPSSKNSCFQIGTVSFNVSIAY